MIRRFNAWVGYDGEADIIDAPQGKLVLYSDHIEREKVLREALEANAWRRIEDGSLCWCGREVHTRYCSMARAALRTVEDSNGE